LGPPNFGGNENRRPNSPKEKEKRQPSSPFNEKEGENLEKKPPSRKLEENPFPKKGNPFGGPTVAPKFFGKKKKEGGTPGKIQNTKPTMGKGPTQKDLGKPLVWEPNPK